MIYSLITISYLLFTNTAKPADTCAAQKPCIVPTIEELDGGKQYRICIKFDDDLPGCEKDGDISHACPTPDENTKIKRWKRCDKMCKIVDCGVKTEFGIKDGKGCRDSDTLYDQTINNIDNIQCMFNEGYCSGRDQKDCTWTIPAPKCQPKCAFGDPLKDEKTGEELFCGRGGARVDCPDGSTCNISPTDAFAVCCTDISCPATLTPNDPCSFEGQCCSGKESCCIDGTRKTFDSLCCDCVDGVTRCFHTDKCLFPSSDCAPCEVAPCLVPPCPCLPCDDFTCNEPKCGIDEESVVPDGRCCTVCQPKGNEPGDPCDFCLRPLCACQLCADGSPGVCCGGTCEYQVDPNTNALECVFTGFTGSTCAENEAILKADAEINFNHMNDNYNVNGDKGYRNWYDRLNEKQFLVLNVAVSIVTCLLVISVCLTCYYFIWKCNGSKYQMVKEQDFDSKI